MALSQQYRLKKDKVFNLVFKKGKIKRGSLLVIRYIKNDEDKTKFGFIIPVRIYKNAVNRNRIKRILGEELKNKGINIKTGYNFIIILNKKGEESELKKEMLNLIAKI